MKYQENTLGKENFTFIKSIVQMHTGNVLIQLNLVNTYLLHGGTEVFRKLMNILEQSSAPIAYPDQWCSTRLRQDPDLDSCSGCALPR